jgi:hypothetical protein
MKMNLGGGFSQAGTSVHNNPSLELGNAHFIRAEQQITAGKPYHAAIDPDWFDAPLVDYPHSHP